MAITFTGITLGSGISCGPPPPLTLYAWGYNANGSLGLNDVVSRSSPVQLGATGSSTWASMSNTSNPQTGGVKTDGTLWAWGINTVGQLGQNDLVPRSSPTQVGSLATWSNTVVGNSGQLAVKTDGTLWSWGFNLFGQLGLNDTNYRSSPVQIGALTNWSSKLAAFGGNSSGAAQNYFAIKNNGTLWAWGNTGFGLGDNTVIKRSSPVQIGTDTNWNQIFGGDVTMAVRTDGTLWVWGGNYNGSLGLNLGLAYRSSPVQVGLLTDWLNCKTTPNSQSNNMLVLKSNGTLWTWGNNSDGQLGLNDTVYRSSPVQIGSGTTWLALAWTYRSGLAAKADGTLWSWGKNSVGQLGLNNTVNRSSPVQVGGATWTNSVLWGGYGVFVTTSS